MHIVFGIDDTNDALTYFLLKIQRLSIVHSLYNNYVLFFSYSMFSYLNIFFNI